VNESDIHLATYFLQENRYLTVPVSALTIILGGIVKWLYTDKIQVLDCWAIGNQVRTCKSIVF
jgi:hypothetical protein